MRTRKRFGQHFLEAPWADRVVAAIAPKADDHFIEIGPGPGALTLRLAPKVARLTAIEIDRDLAAELAPQLPPSASVVTADVLEVDLLDLLDGGDARLAGNLPYNISSPILFRLLATARRAGTSGPRLLDATLMLQREVADRLTATPATGAYGVLSIFAQLHARVRTVLTLPPGAFRPAPAVHSAVVRLEFGEPAADVGPYEPFEAMVRAAFTQRRKTLSNSLAAFAATRGVQPAAVLRQAGIDGTRRVETLSLAELGALARAFATGQ